MDRIRPVPRGDAVGFQRIGAAHFWVEPGSCPLQLWCRHAGVPAARM